MRLIDLRHVSLATHAHTQLQKWLASSTHFLIQHMLLDGSSKSSILQIGAFRRTLFLFCLRSARALLYFGPKLTHHGHSFGRSVTPSVQPLLLVLDSGYRILEADHVFFHKDPPPNIGLSNTQQASGVHRLHFSQPSRCSHAASPSAEELD